MTEQFIQEMQVKYAKMLEDHHIVLTEEEKKNIEICDYNLGMFDKIGTGIVIYVNTDRCCAKELMLFPGQLCPEHRHPVLGDYPGKEETFRCRAGEVYLYVPGDAVEQPKGYVPEERKEHFTVWHEIILKPGEQYTMQPNTKHWFQAGPDGAIISEFSTQSFDSKDIFTDTGIIRLSNLWSE